MKTIVILGPTASGKTGVGIEVAKKIGGEIISADSRAIYKGMDIGTAKPSLEEREGVPHFGFDLVEPGERFTVADFKEYALARTEEIQGRGHVPMVVGGTGLYIDALVYDYKFSEQAKESQEDRKEVCTNYLLIGVKTESEILRERIWRRANKLFTQDLFEETRRLVQKYGWFSAEFKAEGAQRQAATSNIYQFVWAYLQGEISLEKAIELNFYDDWHLAKRQLTWFKRNDKINWLKLEEIPDFVVKCIQNEQRK